MISITCGVSIYQIDGVEVDWQRNELEVRSYWNSADRDRVVIAIGEHNYTVLRADLEAAIANVTNKGSQ